MSSIKLMVKVFWVIMIFVSVSPVKASACTCLPLPSVEEERDQSKVIFSGEVVKISNHQVLEGENVAPVSVIFNVKEFWKGELKESQITITTGEGDADCGFNFTKGEEYLVYASDSTMYGRKKLVTTICDRTRLLSSAQEDLRILGEGQTLVEKAAVQKKGIKEENKKEENHFSYKWVYIILIIIISLIFILKRIKK